MHRSLAYRMRDNMKDTEKWAIVLVLVIIAIYLAYSYYVSNNYQNEENEFNIKENLLKNMKKIGYAEALEKMTNSSEICIIEDLKKSNDTIRQNIMNCGINIASTAPKYGKNISAYAIEDNICYNAEGKTSVEECYKEIIEKECFVMYVEEGNQFNTYENMIDIGVNETFNEKGCEISG